MISAIASSLAEEVMEEARRRARDLLVERLTAELVGAVEDALARPPSGAEPACYLFAIGREHHVDTSTMPAFDGAGEVETLDGGGLTALVCDIDPDLLRGLEGEAPVEGSRIARMVATHDAVVCSGWAQGPALPMRFGIVLRSRRDCLDLLERRREPIVEELGRLTGCSEWSCRVRTAAGDDPEESAKDDTGTAYLNSRAQTLRRRETAGDLLREACRDLDRRLSDPALDAVPASGVSPEVVFGAAYLVRDDSADRFRAAVDSCREALAERGAVASLDGPLPPYHFVRGDLLEVAS